jgi:hypothetical protein
VVYIPFLQMTFETVPLVLTELLVALVISSVILFVVELEKIVTRPRASAA